MRMYVGVLCKFVCMQFLSCMCVCKSVWYLKYVCYAVFCRYIMKVCFYVCMCVLCVLRM